MNLTGQQRPVKDGQSCPARNGQTCPTKNTQTKNMQKEQYSALTQIEASRKKDPAHIRYLVDSILEVCQDMRSLRFYTWVARALPDEVIFRFLAEIRDDKRIRNRGAVLVCKVRQYAQKHRRAWQSRLSMAGGN